MQGRACSGGGADLPLTMRPVVSPKLKAEKMTTGYMHSKSHVALMSHVTRHTSHVTRHTSHVTRQTSHVKHHTSNITRQTSHGINADAPAQGVLPLAADVDCDAREQAERDDEHEEHGEQGALAAQRKARHAKGKTVVAAKGKTVVKVGQRLSYRSRACLQLRHNFPVALLLRRVDASDRLSVIRMRL